MKRNILQEQINVNRWKKLAGLTEDARTDAEEEGYEDGIKDEKEDLDESRNIIGYRPKLQFEAILAEDVNIITAKSDDIIAKAKTGELFNSEQKADILKFSGEKTVEEAYNALVDRVGGEDKLKKNIEIVQAKVKKLGTDVPKKSEMPALEPKDVAKIKGPLSKGEIDVREPFASDDVKEGKEILKQLIKEVWNYDTDKFPIDLKKGGDETETFMKKGTQDKEEKDDKVELKPGTPFAVGKMKPTQSNILAGKTMGMALGGGMAGKDVGAFITKDGDILDGHHRWSGTVINDPTATMSGVKVDLDKDTAIPLLRSLGNAIGNVQKKDK